MSSEPGKFSCVATLKFPQIRPDNTPAQGLVEAGDCVHQRPGIVHYLFDYSKDMEYLEVAGPADFGTVEMPSPCEAPAVTPWT